MLTKRIDYCSNNTIALFTWYISFKGLGWRFHLTSIEHYPLDNVKRIQNHCAVLDLLHKYKLMPALKMANGFSLNANKVFESQFLLWLDNSAKNIFQKNFVQIVVIHSISGACPHSIEKHAKNARERKKPTKHMENASLMWNSAKLPFCTAIKHIF